MFSKFLLWSTSKSGQKAMTWVAAIGCVSGGLAYLIPQGLFLDKCVEFFQLYKDGYPVALSKSLEDKGNQVLQETTLKTKQKEAIRFFSVYGFDVYHLGTTSTRQGAAIGIPKMYDFTSTEEVQQTEIHVNHTADISWSSQAGKDLKESLVLSESAQKFALARDIYRVSYPVLHINGIGTTVVMMAVVQLSHWGNKRFRLLQRPFKLRAVWYSLNCLLGWVLWFSLKDMSTVYLDRECDKCAANLGKDYAFGGIEYYQKKMQQNRALRVLMGSRGENYYTAHGNYYSLFRNKTMPLSERLDNMKELLREKELQETKTTTSI